MANLELEVEIASYEDRLTEDIHHFLAEANGRSVIGFGTDWSPEKALIKAISECAERSVLKAVAAPTSNGFAAHNSKERAAQKALLECKERDAFLLGWLSGRSPKWLEVDSSMQIIKPPLSHGFAVRFGLVAVSDGDPVIVGTLTPGPSFSSPFGAVFSSACSATLDGAIQSTAFELRRAATVILNRADSPAGVSRNASALPNDGRSTFEYYLDPANANDLNYYFENSQDPLEVTFPHTRFDFHSCEIKDPALKVIVAHCRPEESQDLFFGRPDSSKICYERFQRYSIEPANARVMPLP